MEQGRKHVGAYVPPDVSRAGRATSRRRPVTVCHGVGIAQIRTLSAPLRCRLVVAFARLVDLVGTLPCPLAAGAGAVPGGVQLVGNLRPREAGGAVLDDRCKRRRAVPGTLAAP